MLSENKQAAMVLIVGFFLIAAFFLMVAPLPPINLERPPWVVYSGHYPVVEYNQQVNSEGEALDLLKQHILGLTEWDSTYLAALSLQSNAWENLNPTIKKDNQGYEIFLPTEENPIERFYIGQDGKIYRYKEESQLI